MQEMECPQGTVEEHCNSKTNSVPLLGDFGSVSLPGLPTQGDGVANINEMIDKKSVDHYSDLFLTILHLSLCLKCGIHLVIIC